MQISPLRPTNPRGTTDAPAAAPEATTGRKDAPASGAISLATRTEPPSTLVCGRYPDAAGNVPCDNRIYINPADLNEFRRASPCDDDDACLLKVTVGGGDWVFLAEALDKVERGVLSLGMAMRDETGMVVGNVVPIRRWQPSPESALATLQLCVAPCGWDGRDRAHIEVAALVRHVKKTLAGQVFKEGQQFIVLFDPYGTPGAGDSCLLPCSDTRVSLDITVQRCCIVHGKLTPCAQFAGPRPWPQFGQLVEGTSVGVYNGSKNKASLNFRTNNFARLPLIYQDIAVIAVVAMLFFFVSFLGMWLMLSDWVKLFEISRESLSFSTFMGQWVAFTSRFFFRLTAGTLLAGVVWEGLNCVLQPLRYFSEIPW